MNELEAAMPAAHMIPLGDVEKLPYLTAVYLEVLRISYGVSHRIQRICPDQTIRYYDYILPPGTPVSMTSVHIHDNPALPRPALLQT